MLLHSRQLAASIFPFRLLRDAFSFESSKRLLENFLSLSAIQILNYILPLLTVPYLVRVLGPEKYGLVSFAQAFVNYFVIFTDYGFGLSATREISIYREDRKRVSEIFSAVMVAKCIFGVLSFVAFLLIILLVPRFGREWILFMFSFITVIGNILFPVWFFQGMERMKYITLLNILSKGIFTACIFLFVRRSADYLYVPLISSLGALVAGGISLKVAVDGFGVNFHVPSFKALKHQIKEGWHVFVSTVAISLYTVSNTFLLGLLTNNTIVGYYSAAEKIVRAVLGLLTPASQTLYPYMSVLASESKERLLRFAKKILFLVGGTMFLVSLLLFIFAPLVVDLLLGVQYEQSVVVVRVLAFIPFVVGLSNVFGIQTMIPFGLKRDFSKIILSAGCINVVLALLLIPLFFHVGVAMAWLMTEIFVTTAMFWRLRKIGIRVV